jgi:soluble lytic murein transglycosylase-like protein
MQITPDAWHDFATGGQTNPMDRKQSWEVAQNELSHYMKVYGSDLQKVLAAYNWGPRHVNEAMAYARKYGRSWLDDPRMPSETHGYLKNILGAGGDTGAYQQKFRNSRTQVDIRNNTGGNATVTAAQLAT